MNKLFIVGFLTVLSACSSTPLSMGKDELTRYLNKKSHGLIKEKTINGITIKVRYQPVDLLISQEIGQNRADSTKVVKLRSNYSHYTYFLMDLSKNNREAIRELGSYSKYSSMLELFSFHLGEYINITAVNDTIPLSDYVFQPTYGLASSNTILFAFNNDKIKNSELISVNLGECGLGIGELRFTFKKSDMDRVPKLKF